MRQVARSRAWILWPMTALLAVSALADGDPVPMLIDRLQNSESFRVRTQAAAVLGQLKDARAVNPLIARLSDDESYAVRGAAASSLGHLSDHRAVGPLFNALEDSDSLVRGLAEKALLEISGEGVVAVFRVHLLEGEGQEARIAFDRLAGLTRAGDAEAAATVLEVIPRPAWQTQAEAVLAELDDARAAEVLLPALSSEEASVRVSAARLLATHPSRDTFDALARAYVVAGEDELVRGELRQSLQRMRQLFDVDNLIATARTDLDRSRRSRAIRLLGVHGGPLGLAALEDLLDDADPFIQGTAALALADAGKRDALPRLKKLRARSDNARLRSVLDAVISRLDH